MRLKYDPTLTFGNLLQAAVLATGLVGGYVKINGTLEKHDIQIVSTIRTVESIAKTQSDLSESVKVLATIVNERTHGPVPGPR